MMHMKQHFHEALAALAIRLEPQDEVPPPPPPPRPRTMPTDMDASMSDDEVTGVPGAAGRMTTKRYRV